MATCPDCHQKFGDDVEACPDHGTPLVPDGLLATEEEEPLSQGTMVGEYRIDRKLGAGTFGDVYAGEQPVIGKRVAVKVLNRRFASDPVMVSRFVAEARAVNKIRQRNIIDIFSFGVIPGLGRHYFVMELLDGMTLSALLHRVKRLPVPLALPIVQGIADALDAVHESGITHRDLKPDNVFLARERDGTYFPKLLDFGIAKLLGEDVAHKTGSGMVLGTPRYMSPEQARGKRADHRADIYALGVMIHEMLTGTPLFEGDSAVDVLLKQAVDVPRPMSEVCPDLPRDLDDPVQAMLEKRPEERPPTAGKAAAALVAVARRLGLDRASGTLAELYEGTTSTTRDPPRVSGTTVTIDRRGPQRPSDPASVPTTATGRRSSASGSGRISVTEGADPTSRTEHAVASAPMETLRSAPVPGLMNEGTAGQSSPTTETVSSLETESVLRRRTRSRIVAAGGAAVLLAGALVVTLRDPRRVPQPPPITTVAQGSPGTTVAQGSPVVTAAVKATAAEPIVKPAAPTDDVAVRLTTRPPDVEVWEGDRKLGTSSAVILLPRGAAAVEIRLHKAGFADELLSITPDRDQSREVNLALAGAARSGGTPEPPGKPVGAGATARGKATSGAGKMDRILGGRD